jgi:hypothetical protein
VAELGLPTGVIFDWVNSPEPVMHQTWEPVWAAAETGLPINLHANPRGGSRQIGVFANAVSLYQIPVNGGSHAVPKTQ